MALSRGSRARLVRALELSLGLELYACAVLALHARGLRATPLEASPALVLPAVVIPPVFYLLVALVIVRPLAVVPLIRAAAVMCGLHGLLVAATGALFMIPDLLDYSAAVAFALWGSPAVTLLQLTATPLVFARLRTLMSAPNPPRGEPRPVTVRRRVEPPAISGATRQSVDAPVPAAPRAGTPAPAVPKPREIPASAPVQARPAFVSLLRDPAAHSAASPQSNPQEAAAPPPAPIVLTRSVASPASPPAAAGESVTKEPPAIVAAAANSAPAPAPERKPVTLPARQALDRAEPTIRVPFVRIADQLPVEMFARGAEGLKDTLRPGVSLLVPRNLLLPHLSEGLAPVKWEVVADQFPLDELALTHEEIANRLPEGSLLLPLDEVIPQIPAELLTLSTPPVDVHEIDEFPEPFQPHVATPPPPVAAVAPAAVVAEAVPMQITDVELEPESEPVTTEPMGEPPAADIADIDELEPVETPATLQSEPMTEDEAAEPEQSETFALPVMVKASPAAMSFDPPSAEEVAASPPKPQPAVERVKSEPVRRIAALLALWLNGLEIGERETAGTAVVTVVAPTLEEDSVIRTVMRILPFLRDGRLPEPATQATVTATGATVILTPIGAPDRGSAVLVTAVTSRGRLAWLERLSRIAAREAGRDPDGGMRDGFQNHSGAEAELHPASVPPAVRDLAGSLTAFGSVAPTVLRDRAGLLSACLFLPSSFDALPLAGFARDLHAALEGAEIGPVASVILKLGSDRIVLRAMGGAPGNVTMLVGVGRIERPGLARIELDRAASRLDALVRG